MRYSPIPTILLLLIPFFLLSTLTLTSASVSPYNPSPPTPAQAKAHRLLPRSSPSPSPKPGYLLARRDGEKSKLERLLSENRPAKRMVQVREKEGGMKRVWQGKSTRRRRGGHV